MKLLKYVLPFAMAACGFTASLSAAAFGTETEARERDETAMVEFMKTKRAITLSEKGGNMMISGEIRAEWDHRRSKTAGKNQRGRGSSNLEPPERPHAPYGTNEFTTEVNLMLDYKADRTWGAIRFQFSNPAGIVHKEHKPGHDHRDILWGSGRLSDIAMRKAYMGYNILERGPSRLDIEIGRRRLYEVFDSEVQFYSIADGILLKYANSWEGIFDLSAKGEVFVVDYTVNHFAWVGQIGFLDIANTGLDLEYSLITWHKDGVNRYNHHDALGSRFAISQYTVGYTLSPDLIRYKTRFYGAMLHNHLARRRHNCHSHDRKVDDAWYLGVMVGQVKKKNDWSIDARYEWVQAQSIPEDDVSGIKRDNPRRISMYNERKQGFANYKGYVFDSFYAITDNLTMEALFSRVHQETKRIGHKHRSYLLELVAIYAF